VNWRNSSRVSARRVAIVISNPAVSTTADTGRLMPWRIEDDRKRPGAGSAD
jgi:hypothetical protein